MRIPAFEIANQRGVRLAKCEIVPPLMIIAGPNGAGKSTLLNAIRAANGYQNILYIGPHRAMRRQQVMQRHLFAPTISFQTILASQSMPGFEGIAMMGGSRDPWGYDDSGNYLKHALCQIEVDRQQAITAKLDRDGSIEQNPDPWKALRELVKNLLPHMEFVRIDASNRDQVKVLWRVHGLETLVDIDDLSSGEKSIIQMFYPLVEMEIKSRIREIVSGAESVEAIPRCILIDEPELHLHPNLQMKVVDYLRVLTSGTSTQVILATHSPTIVEYAGFEELFLLRPVEYVEAGQNQIQQVASNDERLALLREVFGSTSNITAMQPLIVVEGVREAEAARVLADRKIYRALHPGFDGATIIPGGGKSECKALLRALKESVPHFSTRLTTIALLDRDVDELVPTEGIELLPVSMIENFLIDADSIWEALQSVIEQTGLATVDDVAAALDAVIDDVSENEVGRRTAASLGSSHFYPPSQLAHIEPRATAFVSDAQARYSKEAIDNAEKAARAKVEELRNTKRRREEFNGKMTIDEFFKRHVHRTGMSKVVFKFEAARHARRRKAVLNFFDELFKKLSSPQTGGNAPN